MKILKDEMFEAQLKAATSVETLGAERAFVVYGNRAGDIITPRTVIEVPNTHEDPKYNFSIAMKNVPAGPEGMEVVGTAHTHPLGGLPSTNDLTGTPEDMFGVVVDTVEGTLHYYVCGVYYNINWNDIPLTPEVPQDFAEFVDEGVRYRINISWLTSNWECMFGDGCIGCRTSSEPQSSDMGCCYGGVYMEAQDTQKLEDIVPLLTADDIPQHRLDLINGPKGWGYQVGEQTKTRVVDGGCIFSNREKDGSGKLGCAFHHLGERLGMSHVELMPQTCWQLPLGMVDYYDARTGMPSVDLVPWDKAYINAAENTHSDLGVMGWWCVNVPDAYRGKKMLYQNMEEELIEMIGQSAYDRTVAIIDERIRAMSPIAPMPGQVRNGGRPLIPMFVKGAVR